MLKKIIGFIMAFIVVSASAELAIVEKVENNIVTFLTMEGEAFEWEKEKGEYWCISDIADIIIDDNGTPEDVTDDIIVQINR